MTEPDRNEAWRLESFLGSRVLLAAGLISLMLGAAFFVKVGSDHNWIPPGLRVLGGLFAGGALLTAGAALLGRVRTLIAEGLAGLGGSVLFLSIWGAYGPLHVISGAALAFAGMIAVSGALALIAWRRASQNVALFGLVGSLVTPALIGGALSRGTLAVYLAIVFAVMLTLAVRCRYRVLELTAFIGALCFAPWFAPAGDSWTAASSVSAATVLFVEFAIATYASTRRNGTFDRRALALMSLQVAAYAGVLESEFDWQPHVLALYDTLFGAVLLAAAIAKSHARMREAYVWFGLGLLTRAVAAWTDTHGLATVLAIEGLGLVFRGARGGSINQRVSGYVISGIALVLAAGTLFADPVQTAVLVNSRTLTTAFVALCMVLVAREVRDAGPIIGPREHLAIGPSALLLACSGVLIGLSRDFIDVTAVAGTWTEQTQTALSVLWSFYATGLIAAGYRRRAPFLRFTGIALFAAVIAKVFAVDLVGIDVTGRIISFLVLGGVLVLVAGGYQIAMLRKRTA